MSRRHVYLLEKVESEYDSVADAIAYTIGGWHRLDTLSAADAEPFQRLKRITLQQFKSSIPEKTIESIFLIRLFAVFEGILKDHHGQFHNNDVAPHYASVSWYIDRVAFFNRGRISDRLTANVHEVRKYRNSLVHSAANSAPVDFELAISHLSKFAVKLPEV